VQWATPITGLVCMIMSKSLMQMFKDKAYFHNWLETVMLHFAVKALILNEKPYSHSLSFIV